MQLHVRHMCVKSSEIIYLLHRKCTLPSVLIRFLVILLSVGYCTVSVYNFLAVNIWVTIYIQFIVDPIRRYVSH